MSQFLLEILLRGGLLGLTGLIILALSKRASAAQRHALATALLVGLLLLPLASLIPLAPVAAPVPVLTAQVAPVTLEVLPSHPLATTAESSRPESRPRILLIDAFALLYIGGAALLALRLGLDLLRARRLWASGTSSEHARMRIATHSTMGMTLPWGVLLPLEADPRVAAHESAHWHRRDPLTQMVGWLAVTLHWVNPTVWILARMQRSFAERAADDAVLRAGTSAPDYAQVLLDYAHQIVRAHPATAMPFIQESELKGRVRDLLVPGRSRRAATPLFVLAAAATGLGTALFFGHSLLSPIPSSKQPSPQAVETFRSAGSYFAEERASEANNWSVLLRDGRRVTLERLIAPDGTTWAPDGQRLPATENAAYDRLKWSRKLDATRLIFRYERRGTDFEPTGSTGSPHRTSDPFTGSTRFAGGGMASSAEAGYVISLIDWEPAGAPTALGFSLAPGRWESSETLTLRRTLPYRWHDMEVTALRQEGETLKLEMSKDDNPSYDIQLWLTHGSQSSVASYAAVSWDSSNRMRYVWTIPNAQQLTGIRVARRVNYSADFVNVATLPR